MISVIVPYLNSERWICRCVSSLRLSRGDFEFILVNDHSTDASEAIARDMAGTDPRFVFLDNARAAGVSGARNTGLDKAKGEWITFLDADDEFLPEAARVFERMIRLDGNILQANHLRRYGERIVNKYPNPRGVYHMEALPKCWCMVWNKLIRREAIGGIRFVEGLQYGEDEIFVLDLLAAEDKIVHTLPNTVTVMKHYDNKQSLSHVKIKEPEGLIAQARALEDFILRTESPAARLRACEVLAEHWSSKTYRKAFGGEV